MITQAMSGRDEGRQRSYRDRGIREVSVQPHNFECHHHEHHDDHYHRHQHHNYPKVRGQPSRPRSRHPQDYRHLMTSLTIRIGYRDPFLVVALVLLKILRSDQDFRILINSERRRLISWLLRPSGGDPYAPTTPVSMA